MDFGIGQKVCYIMNDLPEIGLINGNVYEVLGISECPCGQAIDVGLTHGEPFTYCPICGAIINIDERWFLSSTGFIPVVEVDILKAIGMYEN